MRSRRTAIAALWMLLCTAAACSAGQSSGSAVTAQSKEGQIVGLTYNCRFGDAMKVVDELDTGKSRSLRRDFFRAMVIWREYLFKGGAMVRDTVLEKRFEEGILQVVNNGEKLLSGNPYDTTALFYTGAGLGYLGQLNATAGRYLKAAAEGSKALSYHERLLSVSPDWTDAYLTLGLFNFYAGSVPWYLKPVLFVLGKDGSLERADRYLHLVAVKGRLAKYEAEESLALMYAGESNYDSVAAIYYRLSSRFPNAYFYYHKKLAAALSDGKEYGKSIADCEAVIDTAREMSLSHFDSLYLGLAYVDLAGDYAAINRFQEAIRTYNKMIGREIAPAFHSWAHLSLGTFYEKVGDVGNAIMQYRRVLRLDEVPQHVERARARLKALETAK